MTSACTRVPTWSRWSRPSCARILSSRSSPHRPTREDVSPYPGLAAYGEEDAESFFGREEETRICLERLAAVPLLAVVGPSGSGKSSLLRAGLAAALRRERAHVVVLSPGRHPIDALTTAPVRPDSVVLVDQAEEAFALCDDEGERERFFDALVGHTGRGRVVLALRADHTGDVAAVPGLVYWSGSTHPARGGPMDIASRSAQRRVGSRSSTRPGTSCATSACRAQS